MQDDFSPNQYLVQAFGKTSKDPSIQEDEELLSVKRAGAQPGTLLIVILHSSLLEIIYSKMWTGCEMLCFAWIYQLFRNVSSFFFLHFPLDILFFLFIPESFLIFSNFLGLPCLQICTSHSLWKYCSFWPSDRPQHILDGIKPPYSYWDTGKLRMPKACRQNDNKKQYKSKWETWPYHRIC